MKNGIVVAVAALLMSAFCFGQSKAVGNFTITVQGAAVFNPVNGCQPSAAPPCALPSPTLGQAYSVALSVKNGIAPYTWGLTGSLPPGLALAASTTDTSQATISGTSTGACAATPCQFLITVTDSSGKSASLIIPQYNPSSDSVVASVNTGSGPSNFKWSEARKQFVRVK